MLSSYYPVLAPGRQVEHKNKEEPHSTGENKNQTNKKKNITIYFHV